MVALWGRGGIGGGKLSESRPGLVLPPGKGPPGTHCTGGWVGPRAGLDTDVRGKILCPCRGSNEDCHYHIFTFICVIKIRIVCVCVCI
jgi:hypothetical protein